MSKGLLLIGLVFTMLIITVQPSYCSVPLWMLYMPLTDIQDHWACTEIERMFYGRRIVESDYGLFYPDQELRRDEFVNLIFQTLNFMKVEGTNQNNHFWDVEDECTTIPYVASLGIVTGENGYFRPVDLITREEMAVMTAKIYEIVGLPMPVLGAIESFDDKNAISDWAYPYADILVSSGIMSGVANNSFNPKASVTRAEGTVVLCRLIDQVEQTKVHVFEEGNVYLDQNAIECEEAVLFEESTAYFSLRAFFEHIGSEVNYSEETGNIEIKHQNDILLCEFCEISYFPNKLFITMKKLKNPSGIHYGVNEKGGFQLRDGEYPYPVYPSNKEECGEIEIIHNKLYLSEEAFSWMLACLGYSVYIDPDSKTASITGLTVDDFTEIKVGTKMEHFFAKYPYKKFSCKLNGQVYNAIFPLRNGSFLAIDYNSSIDLDDFDIVKRIVLINYKGEISEMQ